LGRWLSTTARRLKEKGEALQMKNSLSNHALRVGSAIAASGLALGVLAGCGSGAEGNTEATSSVSESAIVGGDPATWSPLEVTAEMNGLDVEMVPNQVANFTGFPDSAKGYFVTTSNNEVVNVTNAPDKTLTPGFRAVAPGTAEVTLWDGNPEAEDPAEKGDPIAQVTVVVAVE